MNRRPSIPKTLPLALIRAQAAAMTPGECAALAWTAEAAMRRIASLPAGVQDPLKLAAVAGMEALALAGVTPGASRRVLDAALAVCSSRWSVAATQQARRTRRSARAIPGAA